jgi:hypothetical protein
MRHIKLYEHTDFSKKDLMRRKKERAIFVIFSTYGDREAALIHDKIRLLREELHGFIDGIIVSHRRKGGRGDETEKRAREAWEAVEVIVCNSYRVPDMGTEKGKGADMRRALYYLNCGKKGFTPEPDTVVVFLDADVLPRYFSARFVLSLSGAVIEGNDFARASFWREMGRIKKYVAQPLLSVIDHPHLRRLSEFHYPLAGEAAGTLTFFNSMRFWQMYGVEMGINMDVCKGEYKLADVNMGLYDHHHSSDLDIQKMAFGVVRTYLLQLQDYGIIRFSDGARISDVLSISFINKRGRRRNSSFDLKEKRYQPLKNIL